jgi:glycosyltransferase involved in cell wall biosynthesis
MPLLVRLSPDIIYTRNKFLSKLLAAWKTILRRKTRIIYGNGAASRPPFPKSFDIIQHLTAYRCRAAIAAQEPPDRQRFVPNAFHLRPAFSPTTTEEKRAQRRQLGLPADKRIVLCVSALNRYHKRIDHLIREVARLDDRDVVLVLLGQHERETPDLLALGREALGARFIAASVPASAVDGYYRAADAFVLPSCWEAFGRVIVESLAHGLPTLVHSGESFREIAGPHGTFVDMARPGLLADALASPALWLREPGAEVAAHRWAYEHYSWDRLKGPYLEMFESCLRLP